MIVEEPSEDIYKNVSVFLQCDTRSVIWKSWEDSSIKKGEGWQGCNVQGLIRATSW